MKLPSGDGDAVYQFVIKIAARGLVFIKCYRAQARGVVISITLLAGFFPRLQVTFVDRYWEISIWVTLCERSGQNHRIIGLTLLSCGIRFLGLSRRD